jgi:hypothetical protein
VREEENMQIKLFSSSTINLFARHSIYTLAIHNFFRSLSLCSFLCVAKKHFNLLIFHNMPETEWGKISFARHARKVAIFDKFHLIQCGLLWWILFFIHFLLSSALDNQQLGEEIFNFLLFSLSLAEKTA